MNRNNLAFRLLFWLLTIILGLFFGVGGAVVCAFLFGVKYKLAASIVGVVIFLAWIIYYIFDAYRFKKFLDKFKNYE